MTTSDDSLTTPFHDILRRYWGYDDFRGIQLDIIRSIAAGNDTLGLMPTGGGKSITFQVPALAMEGLTIVVTPLVALMKDQVEHLCRRGIRAAAIHAGLSRNEILKHLDNSIFGAYKFLYVSPERLSTDIFRTKVRRMKVCFITVDEAHCISQWGYDFRPSYLEISHLRELLPGIPVLALTATATPQVIDDICRHLAFPDDAEHRAVFRMSFARHNLAYVVRHCDDKQAELLHILDSVAGSAIVYTRSRKGAVELAQSLAEAGLTALAYHAGLSEIDKDVRQRAWQEDATRIMVATNAFGMGIDKPDVRLVIHMDLPDSIEAYFQEAGRAGRDGRKAYAVLLYNNGDHRKMLRRIPETFPEKEYVATVYDKLAYNFQLAVGDGYQVTYTFDMEKFCVNYRLFPVPVLSALQLLTRAGYIDYREAEDTSARLLFLCTRDELYQLGALPSAADTVLRYVLRHYSGMFADYVFIDEDRIGADCQLTRHEVCEALIWLSHLRVIHYIPRTHLPHITYLQRRVEHIYLSPEVYEQRRDDYIRRIEAILGYATEEEYCRSRYLLDYFGDDEADNCGQCDVCLEQNGNERRRRAAAVAILQRLADGRPLSADALCPDGIAPQLCSDVVQELVSEGRVVIHNGLFRKA